jgi:hypothetical protein
VKLLTRSTPLSPRFWTNDETRVFTTYAQQQGTGQTMREEETAQREQRSPRRRRGYPRTRLMADEHRDYENTSERHDDDDDSPQAPPPPR